MGPSCPAAFTHPSLLASDTEIESLCHQQPADEELWLGVGWREGLVKADFHDRWSRLSRDHPLVRGHCKGALV